MGVRFTSRIGQWTAQKERDLDQAMLALATTIHRDAGNLAQVDSGAMAASGRVVRRALGYYSIIFGGGQVPYGRIQHDGGTIKPKNGEFLVWKGKNGEWIYARSVTIKGTRYLERAGDKNSKNFERYVRGL